MNILNPVIYFLLVVKINLAHSSPKISSSLLQAFTERRSVSAVLHMKERPDSALAEFTSGRVSFSSRAERSRAVMTALKELAARSQANVLTRLEELNQATPIHFESLWISNKIAVYNLQPFCLEYMKQFKELDEISEEQVTTIHGFLPFDKERMEGNLTNWGVGKIQAPSIWKSGNTGKGIVIGIIDTGVRYTHEAIRSNFRQSHGWFDPSQRTKFPDDPLGHGTHVTGILVGSAPGHKIGVAPNSTWIACRGCVASGCFESDLLACGQFMLCPTETDGSNPNCSMAPHVINNSWGSDGGGSTTYEDIIKAWRAAGIIPVFSAGNSGPDCSSVVSPGDSKNVIGVGATDSQDHVDRFSSVGPSVTGIGKPDFVAPGDRIFSAWGTSDKSYKVASGTSMAAPHLSATVALLLSENPEMEYSQVYLLLAAGAVGNNATGRRCNGVSDSVHPNYQAGNGRIDALASVQAAKLNASSISTQSNFLTEVQRLLSVGNAIPINSF